MQSRQYILHSFRGVSLCLGQMTKNAVDNNDSSHGGTFISSCFRARELNQVRTLISQPKQMKWGISFARKESNYVCITIEKDD